MEKSKYIYIKNNVPGRFLEFEEWINPDEYDVGETYEDYLRGQFVLLSEEQAAFHEAHPEANVKEVWEMALTPAPERTLEQAKMEKIAEISMYDNSEAVNSFTINKVIPAWFTPDQRSDYNLSIQSAETKGIETLNFVVGNNVLQVPTAIAKVMLAEVQLYANAAYMVTARHKIEVEALGDIESVDNYDYTQGYPEKLNFDLE